MAPLAGLPNRTEPDPDLGRHRLRAGPALLDTEPARIRIDCNEARRHEALGYVTPDDEHHQRPEPIREARRQGLRRARTRRLDHNRRTTDNNPENTP